MEMKFCQSCGMPLTSDEVCGTNADGSLSADYCTYCYQQGKFAQDCTMDEMIEHCAQFVEEFNKDSEQKVTKEKQTVEQMIRLYCRKKEGNETLCPQCREVLEYAHARLSRCPFGEKKGTCRLCTIHCYKPEMRERMREIMRWAGPRMLLYHPVAAIRHLWQEYIRKQ